MGEGEEGGRFCGVDTFITSVASNDRAPLAWWLCMCTAVALELE